MPLKLGFAVQQRFRKHPEVTGDAPLPGRDNFQRLQSTINSKQQIMQANRETHSFNAIRLNAAASSRPQHIVWFWYAAFIILYLLFFNLWPSQPLSPDVFAANVFLVAVCAFPLARWKARRAHNIPMFELICLAYGLQFGLVGQMLPNSITILSRRILLSEENLLRATLFAALGVASLIAGYDLAKRSALMRGVATLDLPLHRRRVLGFLVAAPILSIGALILRSSIADESQQWSALVGLLSKQLYLAIVLLAYYYFDPKQRTRLITFLFYSSLAVGLVLGLESGFLEQTAVPFALVVMVFWHQTRKFPFSLVVALLVVFTLLNFVKSSYRKAAWYGNGTETGLSSRVTLWWDSATQGAASLALGEKDTTEEAGNTLLARFDSLHKFVWVLTKTPRDVPHYGGATYAYLLYGWMPRFVWPDKPTASEGAAYRTDVDYQLVTPDRVGKVNIGIGFLPESFANFGVWGLIFVMAILGACFAFLDRLLNGPHSQGGRAIYLAVMIFFLNGIGSSTVTLFGALLQIVLANALILRCFSTDWRVKPKRQG